MKKYLSYLKINCVYYSDIKPVEINVLFLIRKKKSKRGKEGGVFFKTEKMILDHAYNEWTETVQEYS